MTPDDVKRLEIGRAMDKADGAPDDLEQKVRALIAAGNPAGAFALVLNARRPHYITNHPENAGQHTDILLGDDGRGSMFWKIICNGRVQEVNAPLPKGYRCAFCHEPVRLTTNVIGANPEELVEDTSGVVIERLTKETIRRVTRGEA